MEPRAFSYDSMGTRWEVTVWDPLDDAAFESLRAWAFSASDAFDRAYSRFIEDSLVWSLSRATGTVEVPRDLVEMLRLYERLHGLSGGACSPLVGFALSDLGYDAAYSFKEKDVVRPVPPLPEALRIVDDTHVEFRQRVLLDLGALGKGYFVDRIADRLKELGVRRFLVNGSGDVYYRGGGAPIRAGLEDPEDAKSAVGVITMEEGAFCASGSNRRTWGTRHHTIDPRTLESPVDVVATWVRAESAALADGLATCLFLTGPERYAEAFRFEWCIMKRDRSVAYSRGFGGEFFTPSPRP